MLPAHPLELAEMVRHVWPIIWLFDSGRYLLAAGLMTAVLWLFREGLAARKIQALCALPRDVRREVLTSLRTATIFSLIGGGLYWASRQPGGIPGTWERLKRAVNDIKNGADPMAVGRRFASGESSTPALNDPALKSGAA